MNAADLLAAMERLHPLDRERVAARMLEHATALDLIHELGARYWDDKQIRDGISGIVAIEKRIADAMFAECVGESAPKARRLRLIRATSVEPDPEPPRAA